MEIEMDLSSTIQNTSISSVKSNWIPCTGCQVLPIRPAYVSYLMCSSFQFQRAANRGDREDSGHDGRRDRVRELHLRERRGIVRGHRSRHDHGE